VGEAIFYIEEPVDHECVIGLRGDWTFDNASDIERSLKSLPRPASKQIRFVSEGLNTIDLTGAWLLYSRSLELKAEGYESEFSGFKDVHFKFLNEVIDRPYPAAPERDESWLAAIQRAFVTAGSLTIGWIADIGEMLSMVLDGIRHPSTLALRETINQLNEVGLRAIPIIVVMSFLIGVVLAYQASTQLALLGAGAFTVDLVAISILREMGVMLTAIMVAGRSGSAFAASLGVMKLNEETDAMQIMGLPVNGTLVLPRIVGLVIAVPLLTALSNLAGIAGAWIVSVTMLDLSSDQFLSRMADAVEFDTVMVGLSKAPVFALLIGAVGTLRGLQVKASAEELGQLTTRAVVEAIFLVIAADAVFSIIYTELGI